MGTNSKPDENPGGAAGLVEYWGGDQWVRRDFWSSHGNTTNNRMAIRSAIDGLGLLKRPCLVTFVSDSTYLVRGMEEWVPAWKARGWRRKGGPPENLELWQELDRVSKRHQIQWVWVRGHAGDPRNEYANDMAVAAAKKQDSSAGLVDSGFSAWLERKREKQEKYLDFFEDLPPED